MSENGSNGKKLSSTQIILIIGIVVILVAVLGVGGLIAKQLGSQPDPSVPPESTANTPSFGTGTVVMDERNVNDMVRELEEKVREGMYDVKMNMDWTFPNGEAASENAYVANSEANTHPVYFDITLDDGTLIYTSPMIPVGSAVDSIKLDTPLEAGDYSSVCTYHLLKSEEDPSELSTVSVAVRITVKA